MDSGTLTPLLKRLEKMALVSRRRDPSDERGVIVELTKQGKHLKAKARGVPGVIACAVGFAEEDFAALHKMLSRLANILARTGNVIDVGLGSLLHDGTGLQRNRPQAHRTSRCFERRLISGRNASLQANSGHGITNPSLADRSPLRTTP